MCCVLQFLQQLCYPGDVKGFLETTEPTSLQDYRPDQKGEVLTNSVEFVFLLICLELHYFIFTKPMP